MCSWRTELVAKPQANPERFTLPFCSEIVYPQQPIRNYQGTSGEHGNENASNPRVAHVHISFSISIHVATTQEI